MIHIVIIIFTALTLFSKSYEANKLQIQSSVRIQSTVRGFLARKKLQTQAAAATTIQKQWRRRASEKTKSAIQIQTAVRGFLGREKAKTRRQAVAASKIQAAFRAAQARAETRRQNTVLYRIQAKTRLAFQTIHGIVCTFVQVARVLWGILQLGCRCSQHVRTWNVGEKLRMFLAVCFVFLRASTAFFWPLFHLRCLGTCHKICIGAMLPAVPTLLKSIGCHGDNRHVHNNSSLKGLPFLNKNESASFKFCPGEQTSFEVSADLQIVRQVIAAEMVSSLEGLRLASRRASGKALRLVAVDKWILRRYCVRTRSVVGVEEFPPFENVLDHGVQALPGPRDTQLPLCGGPTCSEGACVCRDQQTIPGVDDDNPKKRKGFYYINLHTLRPFRRRRVESL